MTRPNIINANMKGNKTSNHDIVECPSLHIKLRIHVQNNMYINLAAKSSKVLGTLHENVPKLNFLVFPIF